MVEISRIQESEQLAPYLEESKGIWKHAAVGMTGSDIVIGNFSSIFEVPSGKGTI